MIKWFLCARIYIYAAWGSYPIRTIGWYCVYQRVHGIILHGMHAYVHVDPEIFARHYALTLLSTQMQGGLVIFYRRTMHLSIEI